MLFLLNDTVIDLDAGFDASPADRRRFERLSLDYVVQLGRELYAEAPTLHREDPERARRLAWLLAGRCSEINAALFVAPAKDCAPEEVGVRFACLPEATLDTLQVKAETGRLDVKTADRAVWRRLAA